MNDKRVEAAAWLIGCVLNYECGGDWDKLNDFAKEHYTRVAKSALEMSDAAAWQPIETAPDNQEICIAWKTGTVSVGIKNKDEWRFLNGDKMFGTHAALGWQPLPAPPSDATP